MYKMSGDDAGQQNSGSPCTHKRLVWYESCLALGDFMLAAIETQK